MAPTTYHTAPCHPLNFIPGQLGCDSAARRSLLQRWTNPQQPPARARYIHAAHSQIATDFPSRQNRRAENIEIIPIAPQYYYSITNAINKHLYNANRINDYYCERCSRRGAGTIRETYTINGDIIIMQYACWSQNRTHWIPTNILITHQYNKDDN